MGEFFTFTLLTIPAIYRGHSSVFSIVTLIFLEAKFLLKGFESKSGKLISIPFFAAKSLATPRCEKQSALLGVISRSIEEELFK